MDEMFCREKRALADQYIKYKDNWTSLFPRGLVMEDGTEVSLDEILQKCVYEGLTNDLRKLQLSHDQTSGRSHTWIGINPPPSTYTLKKLFDTMQNCVSKYSLFQEGSFAYTLEQNTSGGIRPHIHLFLCTTVRPARIIELLSKHFSVGKPSIDLKIYRKDLLWEEHLTYINGEKKSEKMDFVAQDNLDKFEYNIPQTIGFIK